MNHQHPPQGVESEKEDGQGRQRAWCATVTPQLTTLINTAVLFLKVALDEFCQTMAFDHVHN